MDPAEIQRLKETDKSIVWHPFTQMRDWIFNDPLVIERGEGVELIDVEGRRYLDGVSSLWTNVHGHCVPAINKTVVAQLDKIAHSTLLGLGNVPSIELASKLMEITPASLSKVFFSDSGSTAVEVSLKMAFQFWQQQGAHLDEKMRFACLTNAYHGDTIGSVSLGGIDLFHAIYKPLLFKTVQIPAPFCYRCPLGKQRATCRMECADEAERMISDNADELAAMIIEPLVQGAAGMIVHPDGYLRRVAESCRSHDVLLILDEVATGFGRTGKMFACEHEGIRPDMMALAKGISGGYLPLAVTLATESIFNGFLGSYESFRTFFHGHTYTGNPLACAAALGNLEVFRKDKVLERSQGLIKRFAELLASCRELPLVGDVRQKGLMAGIELVKDPDTKESFDTSLRVGHRVILEARERGAILRPLGDVIVIMPPLVMRDDQLEKLIEIVRQSIDAVADSL